MTNQPTEIAIVGGEWSAARWRWVWQQGLVVVIERARYRV